jgi:hypothetical protein
MNDTLVPVAAPTPVEPAFTVAREPAPDVRHEPDERISRLMYTSALTHFFAGFSPAKNPHKFPVS